MPSPLRIGLLIDSFVQPMWVEKIVRDIQASTFAQIVLVVQNAAPNNDVERGSAIRQIFSKRKHLLRKLYVELDRRIFRARPNPFAPCDVAPLLRGIPTVTIRPRQTQFCDYFDPADVATILTHNLDVALRFGFRIIKGSALEVATHGVWSYHHGDNLVSRGGPAGFWEVMEGNPVTGSVLQVLTPRLDDGIVLYRSWASTIWFSVNLSKANYYWKSSDFVIRTLRDLAEHGSVAVQKPCDVYRPYSQRLYRAPGNGEMGRLLLRLAGKVVQRAVFTALYREQWFVAYKLSDELPDSFFSFAWMTPPKDRYWADPFPVESDGHYFIFIEEVEYRTRKGYISVIVLNSDGTWRPPVKVLERPYHLSYPFVFKWEGQFYMIPETKDNKTLELYRSVKFPFEWMLDRVLMSDIQTVDATLHEFEGAWWMFVNMAAVDGASTNDELHIYRADTPLGPWQPHNRNPVKSDVRSSRPAGKLFQWKGDLYRPAQDSAVAYGHAISMNRVNRLSMDHFDETEVSKILPRWKKGLLRNHTINRTGRLTVLDGLHPRRRWF